MNGGFACWHKSTGYSTPVRIIRKSDYGIHVVETVGIGGPDRPGAKEIVAWSQRLEPFHPLVLLAHQVAEHPQGNQWCPLRRADLYEILEPILSRPAMYLGKKCIQRLGAYIHGIGHLGGMMMGVHPIAYKLVSDPPFEEFYAWLRKKYDAPTAWDPWQLLEKIADDRWSQRPAEVAVDLFIDSLREFLAEHEKGR